MEVKSETVNTATKLGYATGTILNDMSVTMWITYLLVFLRKVIHLSNTNAGYVILIGQIMDGLSTLLVGLLLDLESSHWVCIHYGKRKVRRMKYTYIYIYIFFYRYLNSCKFSLSIH